MDFTREPIVLSVIVPKDGCKIVLRSSKNSEQEEYFVDAVEVVAFGSALFFRSVERPKPFLVPATDYEVLEVRETRMVFKNVGIDRSIKIGGTKETPRRASSDKSKPSSAEKEKKAEPPQEKKRERKRGQRRRKTSEESEKDTAEKTKTPSSEKPTRPVASSEATEEEATPTIGIYHSTILAPPPSLISETIARYKDDEMFKEAFYTKEEQEFLEGQSGEEPNGALAQEELVGDLQEEGAEEIAQELVSDVVSEEQAPIELPVEESVQEQASSELPVEVQEQTPSKPSEEKPQPSEDVLVEEPTEPTPSEQAQPTDQEEPTLS